MSDERILYIGALKFVFQDLIMSARKPVTAPMRRIMWAIAKNRALSYCNSVRKN